MYIGCKVQIDNEIKHIQYRSIADIMFLLCVFFVVVLAHNVRL